jgi:RsiW-degrading membrane proteinase PrsW (M82 family)
MKEKRGYILFIISALFLVDCIFSTQVNGATQAESTDLQNNIQNICPPNSYLENGLCYCNEGLNWNVQGTQCITYTQSCQSKYGLHVYGDQNYCYCEEGYVWNKEGTKCITYTESCYFTYGEHTVGRKGDKENIAFCDCEEGYVWNKEGTKCITPQEWCSSLNNKFIPYKDGETYQCKCPDGYIWNDSKKECITYTESCQLQYGDHVIGIDKNYPYYCYCEEGYVWNSQRTKCITYTEDCRLIYGEHVIGEKGDSEHNSFCDCEEGYMWNLSKSQCISKFKALVEYFTPHFTPPYLLTFILSFILGLMPILIWLLVISLIIKFVFKIELSIKKSLIFFGLGILITRFVWIFEDYLFGLLQIDTSQTLPFIAAMFVYLLIAVIEELAKFSTAFLALKNNKHFDEAIDAMIYLIVLALGFGAMENILVSYQEIASGATFFPTLQVLSLRFIGANLLHALSSGIIGFFWVLKLVTGKKRYLGIGLILGILLHWLFNLIVINSGGDAVFLSSLVLTILLVIFFFTIKKFASSLQKHLT